MTLVPEIRDQIHATVSRRIGRPHRPRRRWRSGLAGQVMVATTTLVVLAVVGVIVLAGGHAAKGGGVAASLGPAPPPAGWGQLSSAAVTQAQRADPACRPHRLTGVARLRYGVPDADLRSALAVLREPAPPSQRVSLAVLRRLHIPFVSVARGIYIRYARHGVMNGITYYLLPAANVNQVRALPARCYREIMAVFRRGAAKLPAAQRAAVVTYEIAAQRTEQFAERHPAGVCLIRVGDGGGGGGPCATVASLRTLPGTPGVGSDGSNDATVTALIVPDGVATVTAHYGAQTYPGRVAHPVTVTQPVVGNVDIFNFRGAWDPPSSLVFRSANGGVLWASPHRLVIG